MLTQSPLIAFVATNDSERAKRFYCDTLELTLLEDTPFALVFDVQGTQLRVQKTNGHVPAPHTALGFTVTSISACARGLAARGVRFERYPQFEQDALGIWTVPGGPDKPASKVAWFKDPDGNLLSLTEFG